VKKIIISENQYKELIKHIYQPTGNSCGPTCIKMVGDFLVGNIPSIDEICEMCGTDWVVGTPPDRMKIGLDSLNIQYKEHISEIEPFQSIKNTIDRGNVAIVRTITQEIPHWIVIHDYNEDDFIVNDPWLGELKYSESQLDNIWKVRDYYYFEIIGKEKENVGTTEIRKMTNEDIEKIKPRLSKVFEKTGLNNDVIWELLSESDFKNSVVASVNGEIAGFYFFSGSQIPKWGNGYEKLKNLKGLEGVALGVFPEFKNYGIGKKLIEYSQNIPGIDYIWGYQFKSLKNIDDWLKRRKIYFENDQFYITYQILNKMK
jgi:hypothetical protein